MYSSLNVSCVLRYVSQFSQATHIIMPLYYIADVDKFIHAAVNNIDICFIIIDKISIYTTLH